MCRESPCPGLPSGVIAVVVSALILTAVVIFAQSR
jgi:hypothetical protein